MQEGLSSTTHKVLRAVNRNQLNTQRTPWLLPVVFKWTGVVEYSSPAFFRHSRSKGQLVFEHSSPWSAVAVPILLQTQNTVPGKDGCLVELGDTNIVLDLSDIQR